MSNDSFRLPYGSKCGRLPVIDKYLSSQMIRRSIWQQTTPTYTKNTQRSSALTSFTEFVIPMNTKISYLYRDADNYKMHNKCVIAGTLTTEQARTIKDSCEMGEYFIPRQVGLPERRFDRYDPAVDHCWFELDEDCFSETVEPPTVALTATELVNRFEGCKNNWRDESYTPQMGGMKF